MDGVRHPDRQTLAAAESVDSAVGQLIRRLVENDARASAAEEIILDIEVDGFRYVAVRCALPAAGAPGGSGELRTEREASEGDASAAEAEHPALSPRETEIARMVAKGYANKTIASVLDISSWTVSSHLRRIYGKLGVTSRAAMVAQLLDADRQRPHTAVAL
ncbi:LuxR C-terminal-related transcriptional regulator [Streptomyces sp. NPDC051940]|uniref:helix-turn-helix transcriptional regulator n=1 Tax=Streptomyces sp. NPDC051940 TaxID=3155675 RepID=UPI0034392868